MNRSLLAFPLSALPFLAFAQTFTGGGGAIPDDGNALNATVLVQGLSPAVMDTSNFGVESICISIDHSYIADLDVSIVAPDGTAVLLTSANGGDSDHYAQTCFTADAATPITSGAPPYTGEFRPQGQMGVVNNGQVGNGTWTLHIQDTYPGADSGDLLSWSITFGPDPATYYGISSSDLPIVLINTNDVPIPDDPKVPGTMGIIFNGEGQLNHVSDPVNDYNGNIGIELRGSSSQTFPKKSYGFELRDADGAAIDAPVLGMPEENDWVLSASYSDKSFLSNPLTFDLGQRMGHYAPRWRPVEVILNGQYAGVYILMEKIKRNSERVDIAKLKPEDIAGDDLTGGYIIKVDRDQGSDNGGWTSPFPPAQHPNGQTTRFLYEYPDDPEPEQSNYIRNYVNAFEQALHGEDFADTAVGYAHWIDVPSVIDLLLVNELGKNVDGYRLSTFLYKDKDSNGGKLHMGPLWDFDLAYHNSDYCNGSAVIGWAYDFGTYCPTDAQQIPFWWSRFMQDPAFVNAVRCRWEELRDNVLGVDRIHAWCDSMATRLELGQQHNFTLWPTLGTYVWPNPNPVPANYAGEITELKNWITARHSWIDDNLAGICSSVGIDEQHAFMDNGLHAFPVPFSDRLTVRLPAAATGNISLELMDELGRQVFRTTALFNASTEHRTMELAPSAELASGPYVLRLTSGGHQWTSTVVKQ